MQNSSNSQNQLPVSQPLILISQLASSFLVLTYLAYFIGWNFMGAYLDEFGAKWLMTEVPLPLLLQQTQWVILLAGSPMVLIIVSPKRLFPEKLRRWIMLYGPSVLVVLLIIKVMLKKWSPDMLLRLPMWLSPSVESIAMLVTFLALFEEIIVQQRSQKHHLEIHPIAEKRAIGLRILTCVAIGWVFISVPGSVGSMWAKIDKNPVRSGLPLLTVKGGINGSDPSELRLLLVNNNRFYGVYLDGKDYPITALVPADISHIRRAPH